MLTRPVVLFTIIKIESKFPPKMMWDWADIVVKEELDKFGHTSKEKFERLMTFLTFTE